jgi:hypothetical protein
MNRKRKRQRIELTPTPLLTAKQQKAKLRQIAQARRGRISKRGEDLEQPSTSLTRRVMPGYQLKGPTRPIVFSPIKNKGLRAARAAAAQAFTAQRAEKDAENRRLFQKGAAKAQNVAAKGQKTPHWLETRRRKSKSVSDTNCLDKSTSEDPKGSSSGKNPESEGGIRQKKKRRTKRYRMPSAMEPMGI